MGEIRTATTLRRKRAEIEIAIKLYERQLAQARADLAHVIAAIKIFEGDGDASQLTRYADTHRLFKRGESWTLCQAALKDGPKTTRELATYLMTAKGIDAGDKVMAKAIGQRLIHSLRMQALRGKLVIEGKRVGVMVWRLPSTTLL